MTGVHKKRCMVLKVFSRQISVHAGRRESLTTWLMQLKVCPGVQLKEPFHCNDDNKVDGLLCTYSDPASPSAAISCYYITAQHVWNPDDTKLMIFSNANSKPLNRITAVLGCESVSQYKCLRIIIDDSLSFTPHFQQLSVFWGNKETCCSPVISELLYALV